MISDYMIRRKDKSSPEVDLGKNKIHTDPERIVEEVRKEFRCPLNTGDFEGKPTLDFRMEILKSKEREFLLRLDELFSPNTPIPYEAARIKHLRQSIYKSGHSLIKGNGFETLEKIGFYLIQEKDRIFVICDYRVQTPENLESEIFFEAVTVLMRYVSKELADGSYLWSIGRKLVEAIVVIDGASLDYSDNNFKPV